MLFVIIRYKTIQRRIIMNKKSIITVLAVLFLPLIAYFGLTFNNNSASSVAQAKDKPQIIKFSSTMCLECQQVEKVFRKLLPKYQDSIVYTEIIVDNRDDMKNNMIKKYKVTLVPTIIMLNSDGSLNKRIESAVSEQEMENYIKGLK